VSGMNGKYDDFDPLTYENRDNSVVHVRWIIIH
jgi:hypothetical protein